MNRKSQAFALEKALMRTEIPNSDSSLLEKTGDFLSMMCTCQPYWEGCMWLLCLRLSRKPDLLLAFGIQRLTLRKTCFSQSMTITK